MATRDIEPSQMILEEVPLLKVPLTSEGDLVGQFNIQKQEYVSPPLILALNQLPDNDLFQFYSLTDSCSANVAQENGFDSKEGFKTNYGIIKTNSFSVDYPDQGMSPISKLMQDVNKQLNFPKFQKNSCHLNWFVNCKAGIFKFLHFSKHKK